MRRRRISSYFSPASARSGFNQASNRSKESWLSSDSPLMELNLDQLGTSRQGNTERCASVTDLHSLFPFPLKDECGPVIGRAPLLLPPHRNLSLSERCRGRHAPLEYPLVELLHQLGRGLVIDFPQTGD